MFVIALQIGFAEGGFFSGVTDFFDNLGSSIEQKWGEFTKTVRDNGYKSLALLNSAFSLTIGSPINAIERLVVNPHAPGTEFACGPNTNSIYKFFAKLHIDTALGCASKRELFHDCCVTHDACYGICGKTQQNCDEVFCNCLRSGTSFFKCGPTAETFCLLVQEHGGEPFKAGQHHYPTANPGILAIFEVIRDTESFQS
ncbi:hypothetical protein niasHS_012875 [Heterodera schachtii]|uniref:Phospholipase A(2) n=1 Tax=Heterodera schachtii TaxID=97005 RepID=A0ABD2J5B1_HETSC